LLAASGAGTALNAHRKGCFDALVAAIETKLKMIADGKK
jgi:hypothetical protein